MVSRRGEKNVLYSLTSLFFLLIHLNSFALSGELMKITAIKLIEMCTRGLFSGAALLSVLIL